MSSAITPGYSEGPWKTRCAVLYEYFEHSFGGREAHLFARGCEIDGSAFLYGQEHKVSCMGSKWGQLDMIKMRMALRSEAASRGSGMKRCENTHNEVRLPASRSWTHIRPLFHCHPRQLHIYLLPQAWTNWRMPFILASLWASWTSSVYDLLTASQTGPRGLSCESRTFLIIKDSPDNQGLSQ